MRYLVFVLAFSITITSINAQNKSEPNGEYETMRSDEFMLPFKAEEYANFGNSTDGYIKFSYNTGRGMFVHHFGGEDLKLSKTIKFDQTEIPFKFYVEDVAKIGENYYMFYSYWDESAEKDLLFAKRYDIKKKAFDTENKEVINSEQVGSHLVTLGVFQAIKGAKYNFYFSADTSKTLIQNRLKAESKNDKHSTDVIHFHVFDQALNKVWDNQFLMPYTEEMMDNVAFDIDNKGNAYLLAKVYKEKRKEVVGGKPNYHYELMKFEKDSKQPSITKINFGDKFVNDIALIEYIDGNMLVAGLYTYDRDQDGSIGAFTLQIDEAGKINNDFNKFHKFSLDVVKQNELGRIQNKIEKEAKNSDGVEIEGLEWRAISVNANGAIVFATEQYKHIVPESGKPADFYNDIYSLKINKEGKKEWFVKIPKEQKGLKGKRGMSYKMISTNNNNYFFYIDHIENLNLESDKKPAIHTDGAGGNLMVAKLDSNGKLTKELLFDIRELGYYLKPINFELINAKDFVVSISKGAKVDKGSPKADRTKMLKVSFAE